MVEQHRRKGGRFEIVARLATVAAVRIVIAADKFKGSLTAPAACAAIARGIRRAKPAAEIDLCPMSDGGEGFVDAITTAANGSLVTRRVRGPLTEMSVDATFGVIDDGRTAVIEMSSAAGLALLPPAERNPLYTTTFGVGELIRYAVEMECRRVLLGIGGSATCDAGIGCLQACGCHIVLRSEEYASLTEPLRAIDLDDVVIIKSGRGSRVDGVEIVIACDVTNPLLGPSGAAAVYGPQKGASPRDVERLDRMLGELVQRQKWSAFADQPGAGAAGGIGVGLAAMFQATLSPGFDLVAKATRLAERIVGANVVITGEGSLDAQTGNGKTPSGVARLARAAGARCVAFAGRATENISGFEEVHVLCNAEIDEATAMSRAADLLEERAFRAFATEGVGS
jgi:glycerate 2-kinase